MVTREELLWTRSTPSLALAMIALKACRQRERARVRQPAFTLALLLSCASCHKKPAYVWRCLDGTASKPTSQNTCGCLLFDAREQPEQALCARRYECCVITTDIMESQALLTKCECWNPSQGGPTCETKAPPPGQENFMWKRVDRCEQW